MPLTPEQAVNGSETPGVIAGFDVATDRWSATNTSGSAVDSAPMSPLEPVLRPITRARLTELAESGFGDMIKAVVDCGRRVMVVGGELHADEEQWLLENGSQQADLWGINLYPAETTDDWIEFDSMINVRPSQGNPSRGVESQETQKLIRSIVAELVRP